jgi:hypothetical protein
MVAALLVKRKKYMLRGFEEPFADAGSGMVTPAQGWQAAQFFKQAAHQQAQNRALLHLTRLVGQILSDSMSWPCFKIRQLILGSQLAMRD